MSATLPNVPFAPAPWLRSAHAQTILASVGLRRPWIAARARSMLKSSEAHILDCGDGVRLMGELSAHAAGPRQLVVLLHGWEGSSTSSYLLSLGGYLFARGYDIFRLNFRDHGPTHHLNDDLFHSCRIAEVVGAVRAIQDRFAPPSLSLAGFSLGGNFALRVAARAPAAGIRLQTVVAVSPVLRPSRTLEALENGWFVYQRYFVNKWKQSLRIKQRCFPERFDFRDILRMHSLKEMTDVLVSRHTDFPDLRSYLDGYAIVDDALAELDVPSHVILAADDPIIPIADLQSLAPSRRLRVVTVPRGGHCGFLESLSDTSWIDRTIAGILMESSRSADRLAG